MPNNGIVSTKTNIPDKFRAQSTSEFDTATDMVVVNKALDGINVTQKSVTIDQLGTLVAASQSPTTFNVSTSGAVIISKNSGEYGDGPETIADGDSLTISNNELPSGLTWMGLYNPAIEYSNADVVYSIVSGIYTTWVYINATATTGQALPSGGSTFNTYWAQLGTQGPAGTTPPNLLNWVGTHSFGTAYPKGSVVKKSGSGGTAGDYIYYALVDVLSSINLPTLGISNQYWQLIGSYGTGVTGIGNGFLTAKGNVNLGVSPTQLTSTYWYVYPNSGGTNSLNFSVYKPYSEFGTIFEFNGTAGIPSGTFLRQYAYVNDYDFTAGQLSITAVSPGTYQFNLPPWLDGFNDINNVIDLKVYGNSSMNNDLFMVKFAYDAYVNPDVITFRILINSAGLWTPWISGSQTPRFNLYIKKYNNSL
jgi:hypothetical protein